MPKAAKYVKVLTLNIDELESPDYKEILDRAEKRIEDVILSKSIGKQAPKERDISR